MKSVQGDPRSTAIVGCSDSLQVSVRIRGALHSIAAVSGRTFHVESGGRIGSIPPHPLWVPRTQQESVHHVQSHLRDPERAPRTSQTGLLGGGGGVWEADVGVPSLTSHFFAGACTIVELGRLTVCGRCPVQPHIVDICNLGPLKLM